MQNTIQQVLDECSALWGKIKEYLCKVCSSESDEKNMISEHLFHKFKLVKSNNLLFDNDIDSIQRAYDKILKIDELDSFLININDDTKQIYQKNLENYKKSIMNMKEKLIPGKIDKEDWSEEYSSRFLDILDKDFINKFIDSIYRALKNNPSNTNETIIQFLTVINNYLQNIFIYTDYSDEILSDPLQDKILDYTQKQVFPASEKNTKSYEIERLCYFLNYRQDDGKTDRKWIKAKINVYIKETK